ncbi:MAG: carbohydrate kinase family protein [Nitrososphaerota archaeon]|nr:carbohydrate kinase family protein [Candidatus Bathyarchaeota archaeon]MDW8049003.1 carbohydrate kinase family protein [Nitrososphaerota archaeon]
MFDIVTVGNFSIDHIFLPQNWRARRRLGGSATYVSLAAKNLGSNVSVVSKVGEDFPQRYIQWLKRRGIDLSSLQIIKGDSTTRYLLCYSETGMRRLILKCKGPVIRDEEIESVSEARALHIAPIAGEISSTALRRVVGRGMIVSVDPQGFLRSFMQGGEVYLEGRFGYEAFRGADIIKASEDEAEAITGTTDLQKSIDILSDADVRIIMVTRGVSGSILRLYDRTYLVPAAEPRKVVDTTGSGDVFIGAFLAEYVRGEDILWCASVASAAASFIIEKVGPSGFGSKKRIYERATTVHDKIELL